MGAAPWPPCPLCHGREVRDFAHAHGRRYRDCPTCRLISLAAEDRPSPSAERAHYETHRNDPADPGYRSFLNRLAEPLARQLQAGAEGLDYGSGPGPTLSLMFEERGFRVQIYDPFFAPDAGALGRDYDFITCTETIEHFFDPAGELERLDRMLRPGGWLGVMTELYRGSPPFREWRYARDPTHACFYRQETMAWIADRFGYRALEPHPNVRLFRKAAAR